MARRKRVTYRPNRAGSVLGGVMGCLFVLIGLLVVIPTSLQAGGFGLIFGVIWTIFAAIIAGTNFYRAFGKTYIGPEIHIEEEDGVGEDSPASASVKDRLEELEGLRESGLITPQEYEQKRQDILRDL
ncbi:SHOCT domain-containing protein [Pseudoflavonifractor phocaeensis]|uniref:SHOCT domain-containing protein n=1 Tax=Pseudoflavonifractor phocaeensis TaxID=1870988 RepID=UPI00195CE59D|nr:SHOCT domain-containing protein [Pseudoflavonifractor phocaeensis]MBM6871416.1 SHOCT domain-containing protein [Pseudoflavonifractor phocaeensis]